MSYESCTSVWSLPIPPRLYACNRLSVRRFESDHLTSACLHVEASSRLEFGLDCSRRTNNNKINRLEKVVCSLDTLAYRGLNLTFFQKLLSQREIIDSRLFARTVYFDDGRQNFIC